MSTSTTKRPSKPRVLLLWNRTAESESVPGMHVTRAHLERLGVALKAAGFSVADANAEDDTDRIGHAVVVERPTFVLNLVDHFYGDNTQHAAVAGLLDLFGYQYTGSDPLCLATCLDRTRARLMLQDGGVPVPGFGIVRDVNAIPSTDELTPPFIVSQALDDIYHEPSARAELTTRDELEERVRELAAEYDLPLLIEELVVGQRISAVAVGNRVLEVLPLCEVWRDESGSEVVSLAQLEVEAADRVRALTRRAFRVMGCRDIAQVDFVVTDDADVVCTDVRSTLDILGEGSVFAIASSNTELGYDGQIATLARACFERVPASERPLAAQVPAAEPPPELPPAELSATDQPAVGLDEATDAADEDVWADEEPVGDTDFAEDAETGQEAEEDDELAEEDDEPAEEDDEPAEEDDEPAEEDDEPVSADG